MEPEPLPSTGMAHPLDKSLSEDLQGVIALLMRSAKKQAGADYVSVILRDPKTASLSDPSWGDPLLPGFIALADDAARRRTPFTVENFFESPFADPESMVQGIARAAGVPVATDRGVEAVLILGFREGPLSRNSFDPALFDPLIVQVETLLLTSHLQGTLDQTENRLQFVSRLYRALTAVNTLILERPGEDALLSGTIRILIELGGFTAAGFYEVEPTQLRLGAHHITDPNSDKSRHPFTISLDPDSPDSQRAAVRCYRSLSPLFVNDLDAEYRKANLHDRASDYRVLSFRAAGLCPVFQGGVCTRVLAIVSNETDRFTSDTQDLIVETSRLLSLALDQIDSEARRAESEERLKTLIDHLPDPILFKDGEGRWKTANPAARQLFGLEGRTDWIDRSDAELDQRVPHLREILKACTCSDAKTWESRGPRMTVETLTDAVGEEKILEVVKIPLFYGDGKRKGLIITARDITTKKRDEEIRERYARIFEHTGEGILITDRDRRIVDVNPSFTTITGYAREEVIGQTPRILHSGHQDDDFYESIWSTLSASGTWEGEIWNRKKSGDIYCEWLSIFPLTENGTVTHYIGIFTDISHRKSGEMRIAYLATHDILTGIPNRGLFRERLDAAWQIAHRSGRSFAVGILDLDYFKGVNDTLGHAAGDRLLKQVSGRLERVIKSTDTLARLGGDEFGLIVEDATPEVLPRICDRVLSVLREPFDLGMGQTPPVRLSGSLGLALCPTDPSPPETLLAHADMALYRVKGQGRNAWVLFEQSMEDQALENQAIRESFSRALTNGELILHYQPQMDLHTGQISGVEALVRWNHPERGLLTPSSFIGIVESSNLTISLGCWVLEEAMNQQKKWLNEGLFLRVSVNIGARHFLSEEFVASLRDLPALKRRTTIPFAPDILLEVPESEVLRDPVRARMAIEGCRKLGLLVSLDDFGMGHASIRTLQELEIDEVKIDRSFIKNLMDDPRDLAVVANLLRTARMLLIRAVAKGAESETEGQILAHLGCPVLQGSVLSLPIPPEEIPGRIAGTAPFLSWSEAIRWPEVDMEELSLLMVARAAKDLSRRLSGEPGEITEWQEWALRREFCLVCRWIDYTVRLMGGKAGEEFMGALETHELFHRKMDEAFDGGLVAGHRPEILSELSEIGATIVEKILSLCGKTAQNLSKSLL